MFEDERTIVTGGAGFIGSALVWGLNQRGCDRIVVVDRLDRSEKWRNLSSLHFEDYIDADEFAARIGANARAFGPVSTILHLGACSSTTETDSDFLARNNFEYSKQVACWGSVLNARIVYASSAATYGAVEGPVSDNMPLAALRPLNAYAFSKHLFDRWAERTGLLRRAAGLKYFNVFGPNEQHKGEMRSMVDRAFCQIRETGRVRLFKSLRSDFKDGEQRRDFLYVKDAVAMTLQLAANTSAVGIFNVGSGVAHTWLDLVSAVFEARGTAPAIEFVDMPERLRDKYQYHTCADIERLRAAGYREKITPLPLAVADYVNNYLTPDLRLGDERPSEAKTAR